MMDRLRRLGPRAQASLTPLKSGKGYPRLTIHPQLPPYWA
jgi:hypothetical protein